jgi:ribonucleotide monophosphatase NagD (HAD superfamily)
MIIANPDKIRPDAARSPMPGTIGNAYEKAMGGDDTLVKYIGKPFSDVYEIALRNKDRSRECMIGDALETDITGGSVEGIDTIWVVNDGVHNVEIQSKGNESLENGCAAVLENFNKLEGTYAKDRQLSPTIVIPHFRW